MIAVVWEHHEKDTLLYARDYPGAFSRGASLEEAMAKMPGEVEAFCRWAGWEMPADRNCVVVQEKLSGLAIRDADSDVIFDTERKEMTRAEYEALRDLALRSAMDFLALYRAVPDPDHSCLKPRPTFFGERPCTAAQMYEHTRSVNAYYFGEIDVEADNEGDILSCRKRGFDRLEQQEGYLLRPACEGSYGEFWSLRKLLRRFLWHDRIHARAMYRMARSTFGVESVPDVFGFGGI